MVRDAERAQPGIVHRTVKDLVERGEEPTKAAIGRVVADVAGRPPPPRASASPFLRRDAPGPTGKIDPGEAYARFIELVDEIEAIGPRDILNAAPKKSVLGQRASGLADMMSDIMEGCGQ